MFFCFSIWVNTSQKNVPKNHLMISDGFSRVLQNQHIKIGADGGVPLG